MSFFTSFQELLDFDHSTNLNGFHFSNSLFGFDSNSIPTLENLPPPPLLLEPPVSSITPAATNSPRASLLTTPSPVPALPLDPPTPLLETPKQLHHQQQHQQCQPPAAVALQTLPVTPPQAYHQQQRSLLASPSPPQQLQPPPIVSKFQLKVTPNNEIYISNESGTFCELAGSFVPSSPEPAPEPVLPPPPPPPPEPPKTLYRIEQGIKRPLSPSDCRRYSNSGIFRSANGTTGRSPLKKKSTSTAANGLHHGLSADSPEGAKLVVSNVINNGLIVNKKHLSNSGEEPAGNNPSSSSASVTPERRIMRPKKRKRKAAATATVTIVPPKPITIEARVDPPNGRIVTRVTPPVAVKKPVIITGRRAGTVSATTRPTTAKAAATESALNFSGIKEKAAQGAIFSERVVEKPVPMMQPPPPVRKMQNGGIVVPPVGVAAVTAPAVVRESRARVGVEMGAGSGPTEGSVAGGVPMEENGTSGSPAELKVVADLVMDKNVFGHISLLNNSNDRGKTVIYQNPVTSANVIYSILNPKSLNLALGGLDRGTKATLTLQPHRGGRKPKKRGRKPKVLENGVVPPENVAPEPIDPSVPVSVTRSGRLSKPPRYANNYFQNIKQKAEVVGTPPPPPPPLPPPPPRLEIPAPDPETAEKLPNFSAALNSEPKRKINVPLQYRCATCNKIYLGKRMQRHLQKYPSHNSERDCVGTGAPGGGAGGNEEDRSRNCKDNKEKEEKSTYLYKHLFDLLQRFTEPEKGRVMLKEISHFVDFVRALIPRLITNDEQNSTVEYIDHNVADVLRLNHGKYRLKLSSLAEEYEKLNLQQQQNQHHQLNGEGSPLNRSGGSSMPITSTPNADRQSYSFNADDLLNQSSSFPSLTTLMHEHNLLLHTNNNNNHVNINGNLSNGLQYHHNHQQPHPQNHAPYNGGHVTLHHSNSSNHQNHHHHNNHHHLPPLVGSSCHEDVLISASSLSGLCKSPVQHSAPAAGMVNMALNLY